MTAPEQAGYPLAEALALLAPVVGCPVDEAREYVLVVFGQDNAAHVGASDKLHPEAIPPLLRYLADSMEAQS